MEVLGLPLVWRSAKVVLALRGGGEEGAVPVHRDRPRRVNSCPLYLYIF